MQLTIRTRDIDLNDQTRDTIERRTRFAFDAFGDRVESIAVSLIDVNGRRGGEDKLCQLIARIRGIGEFLVMERGANAVAAHTRAAKRLKHRVSEELHRGFRGAHAAA